MWERRAELYAWLEDGAHLYVCGDEKAMAKDVHATLARILADQAPGDGRPTGATAGRRLPARRLLKRATPPAGAATSDPEEATAR